MHGSRSRKNSGEVECENARVCAVARCLNAFWGTAYGRGTQETVQIVELIISKIILKYGLHTFSSIAVRSVSVPRNTGRSFLIFSVSTAAFAGT
jgi:hypothetical protein